MQESTARQLRPEVVDPIIQPQTPPQKAPDVQAAPRPSRRFSPFERVLSAICGLAACATCLLFLNAQTQLDTNNRTYQDVQAQIATQNQSVADLKQSVGELSNSSRLSAYAKAHGLTVIEANIKRVNK
ncbi:cell division protein FtsL [Lacticaseibacillus sp. N501-2]|jgi:cell division protein FtsL|uniref:cell division protein FtsL n=1 Tax=Lacticaseibacillus salsurae TaxID=3367729 RepID=UPI0038B2FC44